MKTYRILILSILLSGLVLAVSCSSDDDDNGGTNPGETDVASCEGCHTNYDHLKVVHSPDTVTVGGGCGGDAPHYEPYDRVHLGGSGWEEFKQSSHYGLGCVGCHNGDDNTDDKNIAHGGDFIAHPSTAAQEKCASCHSQEVSDAHMSIHQQGWGQKRKVTLRAGLSGPMDFDLLPAGVKEGYEANCATCHASTCGDCHVNRPKVGGGGLMNGHMFKEKPDMFSTCITCHKTRGGHAFLGEAPGTQPDVHLTKAGFDCMSCHTQVDVHGDGNIYEQRYAVAGLPQCTDCHSDIQNSNNYHTMHMDDMSCYTCHSQEYNSCGSCHVNGLGARRTSFQDFKIAMNPIPELRPYKFALVRLTPSAPDTWTEYGMAEYPAHDAVPTYNYTTPHNILRWTERTQVEDGQFCGAKCHIRKEGDTFINKGIYLFEEDLIEDWEKEATAPITVDGKLPEGWGVN